jgi:hypothetical protein
MEKFASIFIPLLMLFPILLSGVINTAPFDEKETFNASVLASRGGGGEMVVEHWTTDEEMQRLLQAFDNGGSDVLLKEIRKMRAGHVSGYFGFVPAKPMRGSVSVLDLAFSKQTPKGRLIHLVIERPLLPLYFDERQPLPQPQDYEFGPVELVLDEKGEGQGTHFPAVRIGISKDGNIEFTPLAREPEKLIWAAKID